MKKKELFFLFLLIVFGFALRTFGINWDQGYHLHPDERAILLFAIPLHFPASLKDFLSPQSPWNPHFFAYGSFPLYLLKIVSLIVGIVNKPALGYDGILYVGRYISAIADTATIAVLFFLAKKLFGKKVGFLAAFFYALSTLPLQLSHFYAVDTMLTFFITLTIYMLVLFYQKPTRKKALLIGTFFGLSLVTKTSALALIASIGIALYIDFFLIFLKNIRNPHVWLAHIPHVIKTLLSDVLLIGITTLAVIMVGEPYGLIDFPTFLSQTLQQSAMTKDAFTFPYTLQYVGIIPYWYEIKNIFLWGQGPFLATMCFIGILVFLWFVLKKTTQNKRAAEIIILTFFLAYFLVVGKFAIGFMRYMLPLYPILCLSGALVMYKFFHVVKRALIPKELQKLFYIVVFFWIGVGTLLWPASFLHIYTSPNTRVLASNWMNQHMPTGSKIALEHWDDGLPLFGQEKFTNLTLPLYDPDTPEKWAGINQTLSQTDYIIIASNRLYIPLQKLTNCNKLPPGRCYPITNLYYQQLFAGKLPFKLIAEFAVYPQIPFTNIRINDQGADESFTVYDHPKIMVFQKWENSSKTN
ncbi:MAG: ArnT family glycosyltransferase [Candidatus Levyibacteriota bacterium]